MPHCIIEYSKSLEHSLSIDELVGSVHRGALASGLFEEGDIKTRAIPYACFQIGTGQHSSASFVHVTVRLLAGRSGGQKTKLSDAVLQSIRELNAQIGSITVEVVDMAIESYAKCVLA